MSEAKVESKQDQPKNLDFLSALKPTEEPKRSHTQIIKDSIGVAAVPENNTHNLTPQLAT